MLFWEEGRQEGIPAFLFCMPGNVKGWYGMTRNDAQAKKRAQLVSEARAQTDAIQRLETWARVFYGLLALGIILGLWHFTYNGPAAAGIAGIILTILSGALAAVFHVGISHAKKNVAALLRAAGIDLATGRPIDEKTGKPVGGSKEKKASAKRSAASDFALAKQALKILYGRQPQKK